MKRFFLSKFGLLGIAIVLAAVTAIAYGVGLDWADVLVWLLLLAVYVSFPLLVALAVYRKQRRRHGEDSKRPWVVAVVAAVLVLCGCCSTQAFLGYVIYNARMSSP